jgi:hypothetical protein
MCQPPRDKRPLFCCFRPSLSYLASCWKNDPEYAHFLCFPAAACVHVSLFPAALCLGFRCQQQRRKVNLGLEAAPESDCFLSSLRSFISASFNAHQSKQLHDMERARGELHHCTVNALDPLLIACPDKVYLGLNFGAKTTKTQVHSNYTQIFVCSIIFF